MPARPAIPACPRCLRADQVEEEEQSGSSQRWFVCNRCGLAFSMPHAPAPPNKQTAGEN